MTSYYQQVDGDGSVTGTVGTIYQLGPTGAVTIIYRPTPRPGSPPGSAGTAR